MQRKMMYMAGRGDGSLQVIPEAGADDETTQRPTFIKSEMAKQTYNSIGKTSSKGKESDYSASEIKSKSK